MLITVSAAKAQAPAVAPAAAQNSEALALGKQIVEVAFPPATRQAMLEKMMTTVLDQMTAGMPLDRITDPGLRQILLDYLADIPTMLRPTTTAFVPKQMDAIAQAYARMFTVSELKDIVAFSSTPSGRSFLQRSTEAVSDPAVAAMNTAYFREPQSVNARIAPTLAQKIKEYVKAHPEAAKGLASTGSSATPN